MSLLDSYPPLPGMSKHMHLLDAYGAETVSAGDDISCSLAALTFTVSFREARTPPPSETVGGGVRARLTRQPHPEPPKLLALFRASLISRW